MDIENKILFYQTEDGQTQVDVRIENDTVWLTQAQMAELFQKDRTVIGRHIRNVYKEGELEENGTCAKFAHMGNDGLQRYETVLYNLDVIISVGYRVKSQRGVKFRQWANRVLKQYLVKGYAVNDRLRRDQLGELRQLVQVVGRTLQHQDITATADGQALFDVVVDYTYALDTLDNYDYERLVIDLYSDRGTHDLRLPVLDYMLHCRSIIETWPEDVPAEAHALQLDGIAFFIHKDGSLNMQTLHLRSLPGA